MTAPACARPITRGPGRPRNDHIDRRILDATLALIDENETPTVARVVARSGVSRAALYRRWPSITTLIATAVDTGREQPEAITADGDLREVLLEVFLSSADGRVEYPEARFRRRIRMAMEDRQLQRVYWDSHVSRRRAPVENLLRTGIERGLLRTDLDIEACFDLLGGVFYYQLVVRGVPFEEDGARARCRSALEVAWRGMSTCPTDPGSDRLTDHSSQ